jgi:hypothetical protein
MKYDISKYLYEVPDPYSIQDALNFIKRAYSDFESLSALHFAIGYKSMSEPRNSLTEKPKATFFATGKQGKYYDLVKGKVDVDFVVRLERKNDSHTISNKTFDFSETTIRQLIQDGYNESNEQMKAILKRGRG